MLWRLGLAGLAREVCRDEFYRKVDEVVGVLVAFIHY